MVKAFLRVYKVGGFKLEHLIPAGAHSLEDDKEVDQAMQEIGRRTYGHPLRNWDEAIKKIGYKRFFIEVARSMEPLTKSNIDEFIAKIRD